MVHLVGSLCLQISRNRGAGTNELLSSCKQVPPPRFGFLASESQSDNPKRLLSS